MDIAIECQDLTKSYGSRRGLTGLNLRVPAEGVFGYLGPNGAGKSTTIRLLLGLLRPDSGTAEVLGLDPHSDTQRLHRRLGYLPSNFTVDGRQTVRECLTYLGNLRGGVSRDSIHELSERLRLELDTKIKSLSQGNRQKVGLVQALMHRPDLLILDEPTVGLDPLAQQTFLELVREARANGQTVFMSSHIMSEVEAVADTVGIIRQGELVTVDTVQNLREYSSLQTELTFGDVVHESEFASLPGVTDVVVQPGSNGTVLTCRVTGNPDALIKTAAAHTVLKLRAQDPDLEDLFFSYYTQAEAEHVA